jgi:hypothetical protein
MRPSRILALILFVLVFPGVVWAQQTTYIYACMKNNNGQVRIVASGEKCLPSERAIQWQAIATGGGAVPSTVPTPGPLKVVDQDGATLGLFVTTNIGTTAARQVGDLWVALPIVGTGLAISDPTGFFAFYQTSDCTSDAYLPAESSLLRTGYVMLSPTTNALALYYVSKSEVDRTTIKALMQGGACVPFVPSESMPLFGKVGSIDVSTYKAPFKIVQQ